VPRTDLPDPPPGKRPLPPAALVALGMDAPVFVEAGGVTRVEAPVGAVWVKTVQPPRKGLNDTILPVIGALVPLAILRRDGAGKRGDTLLRQAARIRDLGARGLPVAPLIHADRDFLVTADRGQTIEGAVRYSEVRERIGMDEAPLHAILLSMTHTLARLHGADTAHGRPKMRDFAWDGAAVTVLDLEEEPWTVMPMADAQARDVFLWIHDLCSAPLSREVAPEAAAALAGPMAAPTRASLTRFLRLSGGVAPAARLMLRALPGNRELVAGIAAHRVLKDALG